METLEDLVDEVVADLEDLKDEGGERLAIETNSSEEYQRSLDVILPTARSSTSCSPTATLDIPNRRGGNVAPHHTAGLRASTVGRGR